MRRWLIVHMLSMPYEIDNVFVVLAPTERDARFSVYTEGVTTVIKELRDDDLPFKLFDKE